MSNIESSSNNTIMVYNDQHLIRNIVKTLYNKPFPKDVHILVNLRASNDGENIIDMVKFNKWINNNISVYKDNGKISKNSIYFPNIPFKRRLILNHNVLYNLDEFTIAFWIKSSIENYKAISTIEIVPKTFLDITDIKEIDEDSAEILDAYIDKNSTIENEFNMSIYKPDFIYENSLKHNKIKNYNKLQWNYITLTYKNNVFYTFLNGKLINQTAKINVNLFKNFYSEMYTIIGNGYLDDNNPNNNQNLNEVFIDDLIIYDKALFTSNFKIPYDMYMNTNYNNFGLRFSTRRMVRDITKEYIDFDTKLVVNKTVVTKSSTRYEYKVPDKKEIYAFIFNNY